VERAKNLIPSHCSQVDNVFVQEENPKVGKPLLLPVALFSGPSSWRACPESSNKLRISASLEVLESNWHPHAVAQWWEDNGGEG